MPCGSEAACAHLKQTRSLMAQFVRYMPRGSCIVALRCLHEERQQRRELRLADQRSEPSRRGLRSRSGAAADRSVQCNTWELFETAGHRHRYFAWHRATSALMPCAGLVLG
jgi:hypothetical protein